MTEFSVITGSMVEVDITSNITSFTSQKKFDKATNKLILMLIISEDRAENPFLFRQIQIRFQLFKTTDPDSGLMTFEES